MYSKKSRPPGRDFVVFDGGRAELGAIDFEPDDHEPDPERLRECRYWRCGEFFEARTANQLFCRKACRSRQRKWERAVERRARRQG